MCAGALGGAFWGMFLGLLFFAPWLGLAMGAFIIITLILMPDYQKEVRLEGHLQYIESLAGKTDAMLTESQKGVKLQGAVKGGPAEKAGIRNGDMLIGLAGVDIETIHDFMNALAGLKAGEPTEMSVLRDGERLELRVTPAARE